MNIERTQHFGNYGAIPKTIRFSVLPDNQHSLTDLCPLVAVDHTISGSFRRFHAGDIIIGLDANVRAGTGTQRSPRSLYVYSDEP